MDNEVSAALMKAISKEKIKLQLAPPHVHGTNAAERAIQTFKDHFIVGLCNVHPQFLLQLWDRLIPQACMTLNMLHPSRFNPRISAEMQLNSIHNFNSMPPGPPGTKVIVHKNPPYGEHGAHMVWMD
eukprot:15344877-Ditylum_brightwellii.AAC.1